MGNNKYNSQTATFMGMDVYNLPLPVLPPADLSIVSGAFGQRYLADRESLVNGPVFGFDRTDNPYLRSLGIYSNLADGLVDGFSQHNDTNGGFTLQFYLDRFGPRLTGTISNTAGSATVTGAGTFFTRELAPGMTIVWRDEGNVMRVGIIDAIASDISLTLTAITASTGMFANSTTANVCIPLVKPDTSTFSLQVPTLNQLFSRSLQVSDVSKIRDVRGTLVFAGATPAAGATTMAVTAIDGKFTQDVTVGQYIRYGTGAAQRALIVGTVTSDTAMLLTVPPLANLPVAFTYPAATQAVGWLDQDFGIRAQVINTWLFYTIAIDPAFGNGTRRLAFHVVAEIEHNKVVLGGFA
jgi:hypothetical protein